MIEPACITGSRFSSPSLSHSDSLFALSSSFLEPAPRALVQRVCNKFHSPYRCNGYTIRAQRPQKKRRKAYGRVSHPAYTLTRSATLCRIHTTLRYSFHRIETRWRITQLYASTVNVKGKNLLASPDFLLFLLVSESSREKK